ncbi:MAG: ABC transporter permease [Vicinamibacterales bacterium]
MMRGLGELWARVRAAGRRDELDRDLREELAHHLELEARKLEGRGLPPAEARRAARIALGPVDAIREDDRAAWGVQWVEPFLTDVRHVIRSLAAARPFTLGVAIALAIGIGVDVTMFGIVDRLMFRAPQGLRDAERVHRVHVSWTEDGERRRVRNVEFPRLQDFVRGTQSFEVLAGLHVRRAALGRGDDTREGRIAVATASYVDLFDAPPVVGRWFTAAEDQALEGVPVAVLSHAYWMTRYGGRAEVLGERLQVDRMEATIIGVAPPGFTGVTDGGPPLVFVPMRAFAFALRGAGYATSYNWSWLELLVRRKPEVSEARANADLTQAFQASWAAARVAQETPRVVANPDPRAVLGPVQLGRGPDAPLDARVSLWMTGVALMVFAVACANVANLMLARAASRQRDVAMRLALGVSRARLLRQMVIESLGLGLLGGVGGVLLAALAGGALRTLMLPAGIDASVVGDPRTTAGAFALTIVAAALTVAVPAAMTTRLDVLGALKSGGRGATRHRTSAQAVLVVAQAALSVVLLVGAAAFVASFTGAQAHRLGLDIERLVYAEVDMRGVRLGRTACERWR